MAEKPELIGKLRVGAIVSGECSICHEVIVVQEPDAAREGQLGDVLRRALKEHIHQKPGATFAV